MQERFVPVALKAALVNNPGDDDEGRLCREIGRSKPAPQGIAIANSDGRVLGWVLSFEQPSSVTDFLDRAVKRYARFPDASQGVDTVRFMKYPGVKLADVEDAYAPVPAAGLAHAPGTRCPATPRLQKGTLIARVTGRALGADGKPLADTARQEHYVEDRLEIALRLQASFARAASDAGAESFAVPDALARQLVGHAFLGQLDVNPEIGGKAPAWQLSAKKAGEGRYRIEGWTELSGGQDTAGDARNDGRAWRHDVNLTWEGMIDVRESQVVRILLLGHGTEKLTWGNARANLRGEDDVAHLPAGRVIDFDGGVRYGIRAEPVPDADAADKADPAITPPAGLPERMAKLGPAVQEYVRSGGDVKALQPEMEKLQRLLEGKDFDGAEQQIAKIQELVKKK